jgi:hypothetical protein
MAYRRFHHYSKPQPRNIAVKYAGKCACCGAPIKAGEFATYYPPGTIASRTEGAIAHIGGLDGNSAKCTAELRKGFEARAVNAYAGDGLDERYEDQCRDICGL